MPFQRHLNDLKNDLNDFTKAFRSFFMGVNTGKETPVREQIFL